jgi:ankyrin repeat protein
MNASTKGCTDVVRLLLEEGAEVDAKTNVRDAQQFVHY